MVTDVRKLLGYHNTYENSVHQPKRLPGQRLDNKDLQYENARLDFDRDPVRLVEHSRFPRP